MNKICTNLEQSKRLQSLGIDIKTADMLYRYHDERWYCVPKDVPYPYSLKDMIPAWSLSALLSILPEPSLIQNQEGSWMLRIWDNKRFPWSVGGYINPVDACYEMILKLHELKML